jgi:hypothetical protein
MVHAPTAIVASDPEPVFPGLSADDVLTVYWTKATNRPDVTTTDRVNALLSFSPPLASSLRASWQAPGGGVVGAGDRLVITLSGSVSTDVLGTVVPALRVSLLPSGGLRDAGGASQNMTAVEVPVRGSWGDASQPQFLSSFAAIALDYGAQPGLGPGDAVLLQFNQPVAQVPVGSKAALDAVRRHGRCFYGLVRVSTATVFLCVCSFPVIMQACWVRCEGTAAGLLSFP